MLRSDRFRTAVLAVGALLVSACTGGAPRVVPAPPEPARAAPLAAIAQGRVAGGVRVGDRPEGVAVGFGSVWVANHGDGSVSRIDPRANRVIATVRVGEGPARIVTGYGSAWVAHDRDTSIWRIDPLTNEGLPIELGGRASGVPAVGLDGVWVTVWDDHTLVRVDPVTGSVADRIPIPEQPLGVQIAHGSLWVASSRRWTGHVTRINAASGRMVATIQLGVLPWFQGPAAGKDELWVADAYQGRVRRLDLSSLQAVTVLSGADLPIAVLGDGVLWVNEANGRVSRIDLRSYQVLERMIAGASPGGLAVGEGSVWISGFQEHTLWRLEGEQ